MENNHCVGCGLSFCNSQLEYGLCEDCRKDALRRFCKMFLTAFTESEKAVIDDALEGEWLTDFTKKEVI